MTRAVGGEPQQVSEVLEALTAPVPCVEDCGRVAEPFVFRVGEQEFRIPRAVCGPCGAVLEARRRHEEEERERAAAEVRIRRRLEMIPPRFADAELDHPQVERWVEGLLQGSTEGIYLMGERRTGKTTTAWAAWRAIAEAGWSGSLEAWRVPTLLDEMRGDAEAALEIVRRCQAAGLLFLDDLGAERPTEWGQERLYVIIDERYARVRPVLVTGNLTLDQLAGHVGDRSASRLIEMCGIVRFAGSRGQPTIRSIHTGSGQPQLPGRNAP